MASDDLPDGIDRPKPGVIRARYRDATGRQRSKQWPERNNLRRAQQWRNAGIAEVQAGTYVAPSDGRVLFETFAAERAAAWRKHKPSTRLQVESHLRCHVLPTFGAKHVGAITPAHVEAWVAAKEQELAPATLAVVFAWLRRIMADAVKQKLIRDNPCDGVELPTVERRDVEPLPLDAVDALFDAMPERLRATVLVAAWTGLRQGEVLGLRKHRLSLIGRRDPRGSWQPPSVHVVEQLQTLDGPPALAPPKSKGSVRRVPLPAVAVEGIAAHLAEFPTADDGFLFTNAVGDPWRRNRFSEQWRRAVEAAGLSEGTRFHDLRHTYASTLIEAGESVTVVSKRLGHASAVETLGTYAHMWPDSEGRTVEVLDAAFARHRDAVDAVSGSGGVSSVSWGAPNVL